jgi:hypothetical protein
VQIVRAEILGQNPVSSGKAKRSGQKKQSMSHGKRAACALDAGHESWPWEGERLTFLPKGMTLNTRVETKSDSLHTATAPQAIEGTEGASAEKFYGQILKSSTIIGGSSVVNVLMGIVRVKVNAALLGPGGVGLIGRYNSISQIVGTLADMGVGSSGVRLSKHPRLLCSTL